MPYGGGAYGGGAYGGSTGGSTPPAPPPVISPIGAAHTITYWLTTLDPQPYGSQPINYPTAELPFTQVSFSKTFNQAGPFSATLNLEDVQVNQGTNWINATNPGKSFFWVLIDGQLVYGGRILNRDFKLEAQQITITGTDFYGYWSQRLHPFDYTAYIQHYVSGLFDRTYAWANATATISSPGAPPPLIAWQLLRDAAGVSGSLPNLTVPFHGAGTGTSSDPDTWLTSYDPATDLTFSAPISQQQTIDALLQQLIGMGLNIGIDVDTHVKLDANGNPQAMTRVNWPRFGKTAAQQGGRMNVLDLSSVIGMDWSEDATGQATGIVEQTGAGGVVKRTEYIDSTAMGTYNYPLTEQAISHTSISPTPLSSGVLDTLLQGDRDLYAYPQLTALVTVPIFDAGTGFSLTALPLGDDIGVFNPFERQGITGLPSLPFPPKGSPAAMGTMRVVKADVTIADSGVSTMQLTLNVPPGTLSPPGYNTGG